MSENKPFECHGKDEETFQPTLLEQVWGESSTSKYGTLDAAEYEKRLSEMTRADLEAHARQLGVMITENTQRLRDKLMGEFRTFASLVRKPTIKPQPPIKGSEAAKKVLAEGR